MSAALCESMTFLFSLLTCMFACCARLQPLPSDHSRFATDTSRLCIPITSFIVIPHKLATSYLKMTKINMTLMHCHTAGVKSLLTKLTLVQHNP